MSSWDELLNTSDDSFLFYTASLFLHAPDCTPNNVPEVSSGYALIKNPFGAQQDRLLKYEHVCAEDSGNSTKLYLSKVSKKLFIKCSNGEIFQGKKTTFTLRYVLRASTPYSRRQNISHHDA